MKRVVTVILVCMIAVAFISCEKEGPRGPRGPAGADGADGADGNANVKTYIFTDSLKLSWMGYTMNLYYDSVFSIPDSIRTEGMVLIYMEYYILPNWWYSAPGIGAGGNVMIRTGFSSSRLLFVALDPDGSTWSSTTPPPAIKSVRVILVPPSQVIMMRKQNDNPDLSDYNVAVKYFGSL